MNVYCDLLLRRDYTTCLRGISILLIAIFHVLLDYHVPRYFNLTGSVCVAAFLFLSGYGIHESYKKNGLKNYWYKRFKRIILPYILFITLLIPFLSSFNLKNYLLDITFIHSSYWFIEFLIWNYLLYWIAQRWFSKYLYSIFIIFGFIGLNVLMQIEAEQVFSFIIGVYCSHHIDKFRIKDGKYMIKIAIGSFLFGLFFLLLKEIPTVHTYKGTTIYNYILLMIKLPMAIPLLLLPLFIPVLKKSRLFYLCGISSFELYLVHLALLDYIQMDYFRLLIYVILNVIITYCFYHFNQKIIMRYV